VVLHARGRGRRRRERRSLHAAARRRLLDRHRLRARVLRDAGRAGAVARDLGARAAAASFVPVRPRLGLSLGTSGIRRKRRCGVSRVSDKPATGVLDDLELYTRIYRQMLLIRGFEELVQALFLKAEVYGTTHLYTGQEAVAT